MVLKFWKGPDQKKWDPMIFLVPALSLPTPHKRIELNPKWRSARIWNPSIRLSLTLPIVENVWLDTMTDWLQSQMHYANLIRAISCIPSLRCGAAISLPILTDGNVLLSLKPWRLAATMAHNFVEIIPFYNITHKSHVT